MKYKSKKWLNKCIPRGNALIETAKFIEIKQFRLTLLFVLFFLFGSLSTSLYAQDTDGDSVVNESDIDDDNDGITDAVENPTGFGNIWGVTVSANGGGAFSLIKNSNVGSPGIIQNSTAHYITIDLGRLYTSGSVVRIDFVEAVGTGRSHTICQVATPTSTTCGTNSVLVPHGDAAGSSFQNYTLNALTRYILLDMTAFGSGNIEVTEVRVTGGQVDTDSDGVQDSLDLDSDNDGIPDNVEAQTTNGYIVPAVTFNIQGLNTAYGSGLTPVNSDGDNSPLLGYTPDYIDTDSDGDGTTDVNVAENGFGAVGGIQANGVGANVGVATYVDVNFGSHDGTNFLLPDTDNDTNANGSNADARNSIDLNYRDRIADVFTDSDAVTDRNDIDADNDGILDDTEGTNFARTGTASQSSTYNASIASIAIDGSTSGLGEPQVSHTTAATATDYWQVDLGANSSIYKVHIWNRDDCCQSRLANMYVMVADTPFPADVNDLAGSLTNSDFTYQISPTETGDPIVTLPAGISARYVRLQKSGNNTTDDILNIAEVQVFGNNNPDGDAVVNRFDLDSDNDGIPDNIEAQKTEDYLSPRLNVARTGTASQSSNFNSPQNLASIAIDGETIGDTVAKNAITTNVSNTEWWQVDLGSLKTITGIKIWNRIGNSIESGRLGNVYVLVSDNAFPADLAGSLATAEYQFQLAADENGNPLLTVPNVSGRYVKIQKSGANTVDNYINIAEVQVFEGTNGFADLDNDGLNDVYDKNNASTSTVASVGLTPIDTENDTLVDYFDDNSDGDFRDDIQESGIPSGFLGAIQANGVGVNVGVANYSDVNFNAHDGINFTGLPDSDGDIVANGIDADPGIGLDLDFRDDVFDEDTDLDGLLNRTDQDDDNDGGTDCAELGLTGDVADFFSINGDATRVSANEFQLTADLQNQSGQAWSNGKVDFGKSFTLDFEAFVGANDNPGADGLAMTFHNDPAGVNALGFVGVGLGSKDIINGIVLELDTYNNTNPPFLVTDIANDHTSIWKTSDQVNLLSSPIDFGNLENNTWHVVRIDWNVYDQILSYTVDGIFAGSYQDPNFINNIFGGETRVKFGFTAGTGGESNRKAIRMNNVCAIPLQVDTDDDFRDNAIDIDSDNDGIADNVEFQTTAAFVGMGTFVDANNNGIDNAYDPAEGGTALTFVDSDGDSIVDALDLDSDNDGITDNIEAQTTQGYLAPSGTFSATGVYTNYVGQSFFTAPVNTDAADLPDFRDTNSDNDSFLDINEGLLTVPSGAVGTNGLFNNGESADNFLDVNGNGYGSGIFNLKELDYDTLPNGSNAAPRSRDFEYRDNLHLPPPTMRHGKFFYNGNIQPSIFGR